MKLVIAEKPSVVQSLARVIGADKRCNGYLEGGGYLVSWCVGHLVELSAPERYDERYSKWRLEDLPILPETWRYEVSAGTAKQFKILKELMERPDVTSLVCATDAGREGELIFRLVYNQCRCKKPIERLWISSMEDTAIREGFAHLKPGTEYDLLYEAALCRERADWIVGMNATRLFSCLYGQTLAVGRVMTPTLALVVMRDAQINAFHPKPFYTVQLTAGDITAVSRRFQDKKETQSLQVKCQGEGRAVVRSVEKKEKAEKPPLLYDLTSLQRDANRILGLTAQQTLDHTQSLYEKKLVTYPRTDSRYLTNDMESMLPALVKAVAGKYDVTGEGLRTKPVRPAAVFDSGKVTDHHAIIPTKSMSGSDISSLSEGEKVVLQLISVRLLCAVAEDFRYAETSVVLSCGGDEFSRRGRSILAPGWKGIWQQFYPEKKREEDIIGSMPDQGSELRIDQSEIKAGKTSPPKHFTEDTLLSAMENAGADETPDEAERKGLGTPATRAATIEKLVQRGFIERKGDRKTRQLIATEKGNALVTVMPEQIQSASMTAEWEQKLLDVEHGDLDAADFMEGIRSMIAGLVGTYEKVKGADALMSNNKVAGKCPHCGAEVLERQKGWFCSNRECRFVLWKDNAYFTKLGKHMTAQIAERLLRDGRAKLKGCRSAKTGRTYNADVLLTTEADGRAQFSLEFPEPKGGKEKSHDRKENR